MHSLVLPLSQSDLRQVLVQEAIFYCASYTIFNVAIQLRYQEQVF